MALSTGPKLGLLVDGLQGELHYEELMLSWRMLDSLIQANAKSATTTTPPATPADGDTYIVGTAATGVWATHDNKVTRWSTKQSAWEFVVPQAGWKFYVEDTDTELIYKASAWGVASVQYDKARVYLGSAQTSGAGGWVKVLLDTVSFDTNSIWDATNKRVMPKKAGYYQCNLRARTNTNGGATLGLYKNGGNVNALGVDASASTYGVGGSALVYCNGTTDYLEMTMYTSSARAITNTSYDTWMDITGPF